MTRAGIRLLARLTQREREVLVLLCQGLINKEIGDKLHLSEQVVKNYSHGIYRKARVSSRYQLTIFAFYHGVVACPCKSHDAGNVSQDIAVADTPQPVAL